MTDTELTQEQKLQAKAVRLKQSLAKATKQLAEIKTKQQTEERRQRTRKLISVGGIFAMVDNEFVEIENNPTMYRLVLGAALQLNELIKQNDENAKIRLDTLEHKAKEFFDNRESNEVAQ